MSNKLGEKIKKVREFRNYTQDYVAQQLKMTQAGYSRIERSEVDIPFSRLENIAKILDVSTADLIKYDEQSMFTNYISNSSVFTTNGYILNDKEILIELKKQYEQRLTEKNKEIERLHGLLEKSLSK